MMQWLSWSHLYSNLDFSVSSIVCSLHEFPVNPVILLVKFRVSSCGMHCLPLKFWYLISLLLLLHRTHVVGHFLIPRIPIWQTASMNSLPNLGTLRSPRSRPYTVKACRYWLFGFQCSGNALFMLAYKWDYSVESKHEREGGNAHRSLCWNADQGWATSAIEKRLKISKFECAKVFSN